MVLTPTCFGTRVPSSESPPEQKTQIQHANRIIYISPSGQSVPGLSCWAYVPLLRWNPWRWNFSLQLYKRRYHDNGKVV